MSRVVLLKSGSGFDESVTTESVTVVVNHGTRRRFIVVAMTTASDLTATLGGETLDVGWDGTTSRMSANGTSVRVRVFDLQEVRFPVDGPQTLQLTLSASGDVFYQWYLLDQCDQDQKLKAGYADVDTTTSVTSVDVPLNEAGVEDLTIVAMGDTVSTQPTPATPFGVDGQIVGASFRMTSASYQGRLEAGTLSWTGSFIAQYHHATVTVAGLNTDVLKRNRRHIQEGRAKLIAPFWGKPKANALLVAMLRQLQLAEDVLWDIMEAYDVRTATGFRLDTIGALVGQPRFGFNDETYRRVIFGRIRAARSLGRENDLLEVVQLAAALDEGISLENVGNATVTMEIDRELTAAEMSALEYLLPKTRGAGIQLHLITPAGASPPEGSTGFVFSGDGEDGDTLHDARRL